MSEDNSNSFVEDDVLDAEESFLKLFIPQTVLSDQMEEVFIAKHKKDSSSRIVEKVIFPSADEANTYYVELYKIKNLKHTNIVPIERIFIEQEGENKHLVYVVFSNMKNIGEHVQELKKKKKKVGWDILVENVGQLASALHAIHEKGVVYALEKLTTNNLYMIEDRMLLGLPFTFIPAKIEVYHPPEVTDYSGDIPITKAMNMFSLGTCLFEMSTLEVYDRSKSKDQIHKKLQEEVSTDIIVEIIMSLLEVDPSKRLTCKEIEQKCLKQRMRNRLSQKTLSILRFDKIKSSPTRTSDAEKNGDGSDLTVEKDDDDIFSTSMPTTVSNHHLMRSRSVSNSPMAENKNYHSPSAKKPDVIIKIPEKQQQQEKEQLENMKILKNGALARSIKGFFTTWQTRYFYLTDHYLYFEHTDGKLVGKVDLNGSTVKADEKQKKNFRLFVDGKELLFSCRNEKDREEWLAAFDKALKPLSFIQKKSFIDALN